MKVLFLRNPRPVLQNAAFSASNDYTGGSSKVKEASGFERFVLRSCHWLVKDIVVPIRIHTAHSMLTSIPAGENLVVWRMAMPSFWRRLFGGSGGRKETETPEFFISAEEREPDELASLAKEKERRREFLETLAAKGVWVVTEAPAEGSDYKSVRFLDYFDGDIHVVPVFSSMEYAGAYIQQLPHAQITPYHCLGVTADFLLHNDFSRSRLLLNPKSDAETEITPQELGVLKELAAG